MNNNNQDKWQFFIDRGGTFTDVIALSPQKELKTLKLLSENPSHYEDATLEGIRRIVNCPPNAPLPTENIATVKLGTTVATNALLEHKGARVALITNHGFADILKIAYQNRPDLFALEIKTPQVLYEMVLEIDGRVDNEGKILQELNLKKAQQDFSSLFASGVRSIAIVLMHGYKFPQQEQTLAELAARIGFEHISTSADLPLIKLVSRGQTLVLDAYVSPILRQYTKTIKKALPKSQLFFMQSNGGLASADFFHGKDSILSGPAGGVVGAQLTASASAVENIIGFDMGGTSTDVFHFKGDFEYCFEKIIAGVQLRSTMMNINTIAAGGGSILKFSEGRYQVGPESAGAHPGPACYRQQGPLTITDCNLLLGRIQIDCFPNTFGTTADQSLDLNIVKKKFSELATVISEQTQQATPVEAVANGFLQIAVQNMANAIKKISIEKGHDVSQYTLCCFGGASGQHACEVANVLGIKQIHIHPFASILSAYGIGLADHKISKNKTLVKSFTAKTLPSITKALDALAVEAKQELAQQISAQQKITVKKHVFLKYENTDVPLLIQFADIRTMTSEFLKLHQQLYGFLMPEKNIQIDGIGIEAIANSGLHFQNSSEQLINTTSNPRTVPIYFNQKWQEVALIQYESIAKGETIKGPALIVSETTSFWLQPGWHAKKQKDSSLVCRHQVAENAKMLTVNHVEKADPVLLEIFNNLFMSIAEQMGTALANTAQSINIKERLDFSCALFDNQANLIANAPHVPVHLGSMSESVKAIQKARKNSMRDGDVFMLNNPYQGGTHLPDITVVTPVFLNKKQPPSFFVASRAHHADIGGITIGSMPAFSKTIHEEGVLLDNVQIVENGHFMENSVQKLFENAPYPTRNVSQNIADLKAQIAANKKGASELQNLVAQYGEDTVLAYMQHIQNNASESVANLIDELSNGEFCYTMDNGATIHVKILVNRQKKQLTFDFTGSSKQQENNFNAPTSVCRAAILYVLRTLISKNIPLNQGFFKPLNIMIPEDCILNPKYPAPVVAGNVETSQCIVDCLYGALKIQSASQGTMNNLTFGNDAFQYYETICGGTGAGKGFSGHAAIHSHMTNTRITDPEILEQRLPLLLQCFSIRPNSGGRGDFCGGDGVIRRFQFLQNMSVTILSNHRKIPPYALSGAEAGKTGENHLLRANGKQEILAASTSFSVVSGDCLEISTPGGGGYNFETNK